MVYRRILAQGGFRPVTWASAICKETGGLYRVNGKHTSTMLASTDPLPEFYATVEEYECDTLEDVAKLYATFDSAMQGRTARDIYLSFAGTVPELKYTSAQVIGIVVAGIDLHLRSGVEQHNKDVKGATPAERAERLLDHVDFTCWVQSILSCDEGGQDHSNTRLRAKHLRRAAVVAAMLATWGKNKTDATKFWQAVRDETGATPELPDRKLARYLLTVGVDAGSRSTGRKPVGSREVYIKCLHAWNAWRKGEATNLQYYADKPVPDVR